MTRFPGDRGRQTRIGALRAVRTVGAVAPLTGSSIAVHHASVHQFAGSWVTCCRARATWTPCAMHNPAPQAHWPRPRPPPRCWAFSVWRPAFQTPSRAA